MNTMTKNVILNFSSVCLAGLISSGVVMEVYDSGKKSGYMEGTAAGFTAGLKSKPAPPKIIIIQPPKDDTSILQHRSPDSDSILYHL